MSEQLIGRFDMHMEAPQCTPGASWWGVKVFLENDISDVMPYLNAELENTEYYHKSEILIWDSEGRRYSFKTNEIAIAPVEDREKAQQICHDAIDMLNDIWDRRGQIKPDITGKAPPPNMIQLLKLLPGTNCKECGCLTCMAFAAELIKKQAELIQCSILSTANKDELLLLLEQ